MLSTKVIKIIGMTSTVIGLAASVVTTIIDEVKLDKKVAEKVAEAIAKSEGKL